MVERTEGGAEKTMLVLHAFKKKTQKTPKGEIEVAEKRLKKAAK